MNCQETVVKLRKAATTSSFNVGLEVPGVAHATTPATHQRANGQWRHVARSFSA